MLEHIWPTLPTTLKDELLTQCVKQLKTSPEECDAFARIVADITKSRAQTVKSQWRLANIFGTKLALARDPQKASPFLAITFMTARKAEVAALYSALKVTHTDLEVAESSAVTTPPTDAQFAAALANGVEGVSKDVLGCMVAVIADAGIEAWQAPARKALEASLRIQNGRS